MSRAANARVGEQHELRALDIVKERPILFSGEMVRALLAGMKTQTRRLVVGLRWIADTAPGVEPYWWMPDHPKARDAAHRGGGPIGAHHAHLCPYGSPGDRLWVRETLYQKVDGITRGWHYVADDTPVTLPKDDPRVPAMLAWAHHKEGVVCPSIHMPRWASRILLDVTAVRVERLQDISEEDARAEGMSPEVSPLVDDAGPLASSAFRAPFVRLWERINGKRAPWWRNPWVWACSFRVVRVLASARPERAPVQGAAGTASAGGPR